MGVNTTGFVKTRRQRYTHPIKNDAGDQKMRRLQRRTPKAKDGKKKNESGCSL